MRKRSKRYKKLIVQEVGKSISVQEAITLVKKNSTAKFDETIEISIKTGLDPRHSNQQLRGSVVLPAGTGKNVRVLVFASGELAQEAKDANADFVGGQDMVEQIQGGWLEFEAVIAAPDMMRYVGKLGRILGPRGLMPNPKLGTVTKDIAKAVQDAKGGKVEYRVNIMEFCKKFNAKTQEQ
ncbi:50S ribosomal protein L1, partial [Candidatus Riflebacteria bacterium]